MPLLLMALIISVYGDLGSIGFKYLTKLMSLFVNQLDGWLAGQDYVAVSLEYMLKDGGFSTVLLQSLIEI